MNTNIKNQVSDKDLVYIDPQRLLEARQAKGLSQSGLAKEANSSLTQSDVSFRERVPGCMTRKKFNPLIKTLGVTEEWIGGKSNEVPKVEPMEVKADPIPATNTGMQEILSLLQQEQAQGLRGAEAKVLLCDGVLREGEREITEALGYGRLALEDYHTALRSDVQEELKSRVTGKPMTLRAPVAANTAIDQMVSLEKVVSSIVLRLRQAINSEVPLMTAVVAPDPQATPTPEPLVKVETPAVVATPKTPQVIAKAAPGAVVVKQTKGSPTLDDDYIVPALTKNSLGRVIIVGGSYPPHNDCVSMVKRECNIDLEWVPTDRTKERRVDGLVERLSNGTPDIKGLLVITSHISHGISGKVRLASVKGKIPTAHVQSHGHGQILREIRKMLAPKLNETQIS